MSVNVVTRIAKRKMLQARSGDAALPKIVGMAFGTGGVDSGGSIITNPDTQNRLNNEIYRKSVDGHTTVSDTKVRYTCTISGGEIADGTAVSEIGLYDEAGDFVNTTCFHPKEIDADMEIIFECDDTF